jgi:hypothetical protein
MLGGQANRQTVPFYDAVLHHALAVEGQRSHEHSRLSFFWVML